MKKFKDFLKKKENVSTDWQERLLQNMKEEHFFSGDETPIGKILDKTFSTEKPSKEEVKEVMLKYFEEALELAFGEDWNSAELEAPDTDAQTPTI